ncbi:hypothetical protein Gbth_016_002 [Gluconobacter thailandicus F149-1 = NBRC 100600]|uniref:DUF4868 domain-containing protein n=1 Tax=Gluconobacter TaxID=441 RepID=UPI0005E0DFFA|nr:MULTISPECIES: DUF4868 domain-containing protein [Gluconobacter]MBS1035996.1 DUF4868 domain-containing protein [Gluconobacter cerinus]GAN92803.1 hypothetical protein Gbth_016_002 [Gluconobacter thailandicus F149-1 = NBRC 100600]GEL88225.1 hypothetical protein GTH01_25830 [Gluconobacter thailandicus F149-1 = NBRC 100600]
MPVNLLAICRSAPALIVKRIKVTAAVQNQLEGIFIQQEQMFVGGVTDEVPFDGGWSPDPHEHLVAQVTDEAAAIFAAAQGNIVAMPEVDPANFEAENIRALGVLVQRPSGPRLLLQEFSARQMLERRFSLILDGNTFNRLVQPAFAIGASLAGFVEDDKIKFQKFSRIKLIFNLTSLYQEATDTEVEGFCGLECISVGDIGKFKNLADQKMRKLINAITKRGTLNNFTPAQIQVAAADENFQIAVADGKIIIPSMKAEAKALLHFLDNGLYRGPLGGEIFITNSKRALTPTP